MASQRVTMTAAEVTKVEQLLTAVRGLSGNDQFSDSEVASAIVEVEDAVGVRLAIAGARPRPAGASRGPPAGAPSSIRSSRWG